MAITIVWSKPFVRVQNIHTGTKWCVVGFENNLKEQEEETQLGQVKRKEIWVRCQKCNLRKHLKEPSLVSLMIPVSGGGECIQSCKILLLSLDNKNSNSVLTLVS